MRCLCAAGGRARQDNDERAREKKKDPALTKKRAPSFTPETKNNRTQTVRRQVRRQRRRLLAHLHARPLERERRLLPPGHQGPHRVGGPRRRAAERGRHAHRVDVAAWRLKERSDLFVFGRRRRRASWEEEDPGRRDGRGRLESPCFPVSFLFFLSLSPARRRRRRAGGSGA